MADNEEGKPNGVLGTIMPGEMSKANQHNNIEIWKQQKDPTYVPKFIHPKPVELSIPEVDRNADRSGVNGIIKDEPQLEKPPITPDYQIEGRRGDESVPPMLAMYLKKVAEQKKLKEQEPTEEPKEPPAEPAKEQPEEPQKETPKGKPVEGLVPDTMPGIWKVIGYSPESYYDFGTRTLSQAGKKPSLTASLNAYKKNMLLTVARALLLKKYGHKVTPEQVRLSVASSWERNGRMKKYAEVLTENDSEATRGAIEKILDDSTRFMTETVNVPAKYMSGYVGEKWSIKGFILWCKKTGQIEFRKAGWRSVKK